MSQFAPVSITVYDRVDHLKKTIEALKLNPESPDTVLYIFSDAARPGHEDKIEKVRAYIRGIDGFAEVRTHFQDRNSYFRNIEEAREIPLREFGRLIRMEDDIVVSPHFLTYMNDALDRYCDDARVFSISGYAPALPDQASQAAFLSKDFSAWGYATWADRELTSCLNRRDYYTAFQSNPAAKRAALRLHPTMLATVRLIERGRANPNDYKASAHQFLSGTYSLKPPKSLVRNIGFDGSGMAGSGARSTRFDTEYAVERPHLPDKLAYDETIDMILFNQYFPKSWRMRLNVWKLDILGRLPDRLYFLLRKTKGKLNGRLSASQQRN
ncbi:hypothetical protein [Sulfitobacter sp.]|uniref:hypothetical protein n=1 Tax=Sulfitobacter sp. TaxID=1903071 RepID=UPI0026387770|nr:hypothetical protein [Sulfitobacter sp.]